jgi:hypothetical protein
VRSLGKVFVAFLVLIIGLFAVMKIAMPNVSGPSEAQVKAYGRTTEGIQSTCGKPDRSWSDNGALGETLTYAYESKGAYVHFLVLDDKAPLAVTVSRGKKTYKIDAPEVATILPCALR